MNRYDRRCYWHPLGPLAGQPCRPLERPALTHTVLVEFQTGEVRRVPSMTVRCPSSKREGTHEQPRPGQGNSARTGAIWKTRHDRYFPDHSA